MKWKSPAVWSQSTARKELLGSKSRNPSIAAESLLGKRTVARAVRVLRRGGRRRAFRGNPLPAVAGLLGGLGGIGRRVDPRKHAQRLRHIETRALEAEKGNKASLAELEKIAHGLAWPGQWADLQQAALQRFELISQNLRQAADEAEQKHSAAAAAAERRESRFLEAGTSVGSALAQGLGRSRRRPVRRRRPRYY